MKKIVILFAAVLMISSCKKETIEPVEPTPTPTVTTGTYSVSIAAYNEAGFDNNLTVVFNSDTLGNLQNAQTAVGTDIDALYLAGNTISGELTTQVSLGDSVYLKLIDANGVIAISYAGTMDNDVYGGENHLYYNHSGGNINYSSLIGGLSFQTFNAVDMEFKYSMVFSFGN